MKKTIDDLQTRLICAEARAICAETVIEEVMDMLIRQKVVSAEERLRAFIRKTRSHGFEDYRKDVTNAHHAGP